MTSRRETMLLASGVTPFSVMSTPNDRLTELEIKISFLEAHVSEQDRVILKATERIERLHRRLDALTTRIDDSSTPSAAERPEPPPPHY